MVYRWILNIFMYFIPVIHGFNEQRVSIPLVTNIKAPLVADLDISELGSQLKAIIQEEVKQLKEAIDVEIKLKFEEMKHDVGLAQNASVVRTECPTGWFKFGDACFLFSRESLNWYNADGSCRAHNARLAEVVSAEQMKFLRTKAKLHGHGTGFWLGGRDDVQEGVWQWASTGKKFIYTDWAPYEPRDGVKGQCLHMWSSRNWSWDDTTCTTAMGYICESKI